MPRQNPDKRQSKAKPVAIIILTVTLTVLVWALIFILIRLYPDQILRWFIDQLPLVR